MPTSDDDQIEAGQLAGGDHLGQRGGNFAAGVAGRQRAHEDVRMLDGVHADAVAEQRAAGALARGSMEIRPIPTASLLVEAEAPHDPSVSDDLPRRRCR